MGYLIGGISNNFLESPSSSTEHGLLEERVLGLVRKQGFHLMTLSLDNGTRQVIERLKWTSTAEVANDRVHSIEMGFQSTGGREATAVGCTSLLES